MRYKLTQDAYGRAVGDEVDLDSGDELVQINVAAGVLEPVGDPDKMTCPACAETMKRPPKLATPDELSSHYEAKHPGLVLADWKSDPGKE